MLTKTATATLGPLLEAPGSTIAEPNALPGNLLASLLPITISWEVVVIILGILLGSLGVAVSIYFGKKNSRLERAVRSLTWQQVQIGVTHLLDIAKEQFKPQVILCVSGPGAVVTNLALAQSDWYPPVFVAMQCDRRCTDFSAPPQEHYLLRTTKWDLYIPEALLSRTEDRLLLMVECIITGESHAAIVTFLESHGWPSDRLFVAALVCSKVAIDAGKAPRTRWWETSHSEFYFPWGKWY